MSQPFDLSRFPDLPPEVVTAFATQQTALEAARFEASVERAARQHLLARQQLVGELAELLQSAVEGLEEALLFRAGRAHQVLAAGRQLRIGVGHGVHDDVHQAVQRASGPVRIRRRRQEQGPDLGGQARAHGQSPLSTGQGSPSGERIAATRRTPAPPAAGGSTPPAAGSRDRRSRPGASPPPAGSDAGPADRR